jgi:hypothetical protein
MQFQWPLGAMMIRVLPKNDAKKNFLEIQWAKKLLLLRLAILEKRLQDRTTIISHL